MFKSRPLTSVECFILALACGVITFFGIYFKYRTNTPKSLEFTPVEQAALEKKMSAVVPNDIILKARKDNLWLPDMVQVLTVDSGPTNTITYIDLRSRLIEAEHISSLIQFESMGIGNLIIVPKDHTQEFYAKIVWEARKLERR